MRHILVFLPCCSLSEVIFHPDECFCKDPTAPLFRLSKISSKCQVRQNEPIVGRSRNFRFRSIWAFATHSTNDRYLRSPDGWSRRKAVIRKLRKFAIRSAMHDARLCRFPDPGFSSASVANLRAKHFQALPNEGRERSPSLGGHHRAVHIGLCRRKVDIGPAGKRHLRFASAERPNFLAAHTPSTATNICTPWQIVKIGFLAS